jgi:hypothetical protein
MSLCERQERTVNISTRRIVDMAVRVRDFCRTHTDPTNAGYTAAVARLEDRLTRIQVLAEQQVSGRLTVTGAVATTQDLRKEILETVTLLIGVARAAAREEPDLRAGITRLPVNASHQELLTRARVAVDTAGTHRDLLVKYGMAENLVEQFSAKLDEFEQVVNERNAGRAAHVGARGDLPIVKQEIMDLIGQIGAITRYRYRQDAESLAAWNSARNVAWPLKPEKEEPTPDSADKPAA